MNRAALVASHLAEFKVGGAIHVALFDLVHAYPQRVESQFRTEPHFLGGLQCQYFNEQLHWGASLSMKAALHALKPSLGKQQEACMYLKEISELMANGRYKDRNGKLRKINNDRTKLPYAVKISEGAKRLVHDIRFRTRNIPGTHEIREKIGKMLATFSKMLANL